MGTSEIQHQEGVGDQLEGHAENQRVRRAMGPQCLGERGSAGRTERRDGDLAIWNTEYYCLYMLYFSILTKAC